MSMLYNNVASIKVTHLLAPRAMARVFLASMGFKPFLGNTLDEVPYHIRAPTLYLLEYKAQSILLYIFSSSIKPMVFWA